MRRTTLLVLALWMISWLPAGAAAASPDVTRPVLGFSHMEQLYQAGMEQDLSFSLDLGALGGARKEAVRLFAGMLQGIAVRVSHQSDEAGAREAVAVTGPGGTLLALTRLESGADQWLLSPALSQPLHLPADAGFLGVLPGAEGLPDWTAWLAAPADVWQWEAFVAAHPPLADGEQGYAYLLEGETGHKALLALLGTLDFGVISPLVPRLLQPLQVTEPVSLFWKEDAAGRLLSARLVTGFSHQGQAPWEVSLSYTRSTRKAQENWSLEASWSREGEQNTLACSSQTTLEGQQLKRRLRIKMDARWNGHAKALDLRQNDTNTFQETAEGLRESLTRSWTVTYQDKDPAVANRNRAQLSLEAKLKGTLVTGPGAAAIEDGSLELSLAQGGDTALEVQAPFVLRYGPGVPWTPPADALAVDPAQEAGQAVLLLLRQKLADQMLSVWMDGMGVDTLDALLPEEAKSDILPLENLEEE